MSELAAVLPLAAADIEGIGNKARRLAVLNQRPSSQFAVPTGAVVTVPGTPASDLTDRCTELLGPGPFAVRSSAAIEDGRAASCAGQFETELDVDATDLAAAVDRVFASYGNRRSAGDCVLVQPMIDPDFAGVVFSQAPDNAATAYVEWTRGLGDDLVSGRTAPSAVRIGRFTGRAVPALKGAFVPVLERVTVAAALLEATFGCPQDVEWAYAGGRLWILQSRDITARTDSPAVSHEQRAWVEALAKDGSGPNRLVASPTDELVPDPTPFTRSLLRALYGDSLGTALGSLGLAASGADYLHEAFGRLYADPAVERRIFGRTLQSWMGWARLRRRVRRDPDHWLKTLAERVDAMACGSESGDPCAALPQEAAGRVIRQFEHYVYKVYPTAFMATLLAHATAPQGAEASATADLCAALARLHHNRDLEAFEQSWSHRAALDYELACPRFGEDPASALSEAARFSDFPWGERGSLPKGFLYFKELAKDRAVRRLGDLRRALLDLAASTRDLDLDVFVLDIDTIRLIAEGTIDAAAVRDAVATATNREQAWARVSLGEALDMHVVEQLAPVDEVSGARAEMLGPATAFAGTVCMRDADVPLDKAAINEPVVLVTPTLDPAVVGEFPGTVGCLTDVGGRLSHAAIVAREMNYPVACLPGGTEALRDGDFVEVTATGNVAVRPASHETRGHRGAHRPTATGRSASARI